MLFSLFLSPLSLGPVPSGCMLILASVFILCHSTQTCHSFPSHPYQIQFQGWLTQSHSYIIGAPLRTVQTYFCPLCLSFLPQLSQKLPAQPSSSVPCTPQLLHIGKDHPCALKSLSLKTNQLPSPSRQSSSVNNLSCQKDLIEDVLL